MKRFWRSTSLFSTAALILAACGTGGTGATPTAVQAGSSTPSSSEPAAASEREIDRKVRIPAALPYFFTALKVGATLSLIGAIVGEYFGGANDALGRLIVENAAFLHFSTAWAAIIIAAALGIAFYLLIITIERATMPWHASMRARDT